MVSCAKFHIKPVIAVQAIIIQSVYMLRCLDRQQITIIQSEISDDITLQQSASLHPVPLAITQRILHAHLHALMKQFYSLKGIRFVKVSARSAQACMAHIPPSVMNALRPRNVADSQGSFHVSKQTKLPLSASPTTMEMQSSRIRREFETSN